MGVEVKVMKRFNNILSVINDKNPNKELILKSIEIAKSNQAKLTFISIVPIISAGIGMPPGGPISKDLQQHILSDSLSALHKTLSAYDGCYNFEVIVLAGDHCNEIIKRVITEKHDLLISLPFKKNILDHIFTSKDMHLFRKCPCPIMFVNDVEKLTFKRIIAAVDFDRFKDTHNDILSDEITSLASQIALMNFAHLHIVNIYNPRYFRIASNWADQPEKLEREMKDYEYKYAKQLMEELMERLKTNIGEEMYNQISIQTHLIFGSAEEQLPLFATKNHCDLLVMGTVARTGISGLLIGNTAEDILSQLKCSVLAIKPKGFVSPITIN